MKGISFRRGRFGARFALQAGQFPATCRRISYALVGAIYLLTSGCASYLNPYPEAPELQGYVYGTPPVGTSGGEGSAKFAGRLANAIDVANAQRLTYIEAARQQSVTRQIGAVALTGMSAAALFLGITSDSRASRDFITGAGIAGAGMLALDSFVLSRPRQALHLRAAAAIDCAVLSMRPYLIPESNFDQFKRDIESAASNVAALGAQIDRAASAAEALYKFDATNLSAASATAAIDKARSTRGEFDLALRNAATFRANVETADAALIGNVRQIVSTVNIEAEKTEPELASLQTSLTALPNLAAGVVPGGNYTLKAKPKGSLQSTNDNDSLRANLILQMEEELDEQLRALNTLLATTQSSVEKLRPVLENYEALRTQVTGSISDCRPAGVVLAFSVSPDISELTVQPGKSYDFSVHVDSGVPRAALAGATMADTRIDILLSNGVYLVRLVVGASASGENTLLFGDGSDPARKSILIKVGTSPDPQTATTVTGETSHKEANSEVALLEIDTKDLSSRTVEQTMTLQAGLNAWASGETPPPVAELCVDGIVGDQTREAISAYRKHFALQVDDSAWIHLSQGLVGRALPAADRDAAAVRNEPISSAEKAMSDVEVKAMQAGLSIPQTEKFDLATRNAIVALQTASELPVTGVILSRNIARHIADASAKADCSLTP